MAFPEITTLDKKNHELYEKSLKENMKIAYQLFINEEFDCLVEELKESGCTVLRNGVKKRKLKTRIGSIELSIPQLRYQNFKPSLYEPYSRVEKALGSCIQEMFLNGVSTRKTSNILKQLGMENFDKSSVSRLNTKLDEELNPWLKRDLSKKNYPFLMIDARYEKIRQNHQVISNAVYVIVGIDEEGFRDILGVHVDMSESHLAWKDAFLDLKHRGLTGVKYIVSDQHAGLVKAIQEVFLGTIWQRCAVHYQRNVMSKISPKLQSHYRNKVSLIWKFTTKESARNYVKEFVKELRNDSLDKVADFIEETVEDSLSVFDLHEDLRKKLKSTNMLERFNQELKRRSKVVRIFPNDKSCLRLLGMICKQQAENWLSNRKYIDLEKNTELAFAPLQPALQELKHVN